MEIVTDKFVNIHFTESERKKAESLVRRLKKADYSVEVDGLLEFEKGECDEPEDKYIFQLLNTFIRTA